MEVQGISEKAQGPLGCNLGVELAHGTGSGIARIDKGFLVFGASGYFLALPLIERFEIVAAHVNFTAHLQVWRRICGQAQGNLPNGADVVRHIFTPSAIAPGGGLDQHMLGVAQADGQAVKFQLGHIGQRRIGLAALELFSHPLIEQPRPLLTDVGLGLDAEHGHFVLDAGKGLNRCAAHALGGRVGRAPFRVGLFQALQLAKQAVVLRIGDGGRVQHVIQMPVVAQLFAQLSHARGRCRNMRLIRDRVQCIHGVASWALDKPGIN